GDFPNGRRTEPENVVGIFVVAADENLVQAFLDGILKLGVPQAQKYRDAIEYVFELIADFKFVWVFLLRSLFQSAEGLVTSYSRPRLSRPWTDDRSVPFTLPEFKGPVTACG
ncbi:MAG: hypothetical protein AAFR36_30145, partial [Bacteroidota bacterium]